MAKKQKHESPQNFVAKYAREFNKAQVHRDRTKYNKKQKHRNSTEYDAFFMIDKSVSISLYSV
jgi:hypothetical protein